MASSLSLSATIEKLNKTFGPGTIGRKSEMPIQEIKVIPSGCLLFDLRSGIGGWPRGRFSVIWGPKDTWKSTTILGAEASCQAIGLPVVHIEQERKYTDAYAQEQGIDTNHKDYYFSEPDTIEETLDVICGLLRCGDEIGLITIDSVGMMIPQFLEGQTLKKGKTEDGKVTGKNPTASQARALNLGMPRVLYWMRKQAKLGQPLPAIVFVQHARFDPTAGQFADPMYMPGGNQFEHAMAIKVKVVPGSADKIVTKKDKITKTGGRKQKVGKTLHGTFEKNHADSQSEGNIFEFDIRDKTVDDELRGINILKDRKATGILSGAIEMKGSGFTVYRGEDNKRLILKNEDSLDSWLLKQDYFDLYDWFIGGAI